jgi:hypothetical protein
MIRFLYPNGARKALIFSYDDGQRHDRRLVEMFNRCGVRGTFHLNSARLSQDNYISAEEVGSLYSGHEVSCHGAEHRPLCALKSEDIVREIWEDRRALERLSGGIVNGMSYAYGAYDDHAVKVLAALGIKYARTAEATMRFDPPADFMRWGPTCHHNTLFSDDSLIKSFLEPKALFPEPELFYIWGHSYEFELQGTWDKMEAVCRTLAACGDVWNATSAEYYSYRQATDSLIFSVSGSIIYNPSKISVWIEDGGVVRKL